MKFLDDAEPFRIKMVEPIKKTTREEREKLVKEADFNIFKIPAENVFIDMLTDSGTSAMSSKQWGGIMTGDESYAGSSSFYRLIDSVQDIMQFPYVQPTHQGRAADFIMSQLYASKGGYILGNLHFDSFKGHSEIAGSIPVDLIIEEGRTANSNPHPFKGNMDLEKLKNFINEKGKKNIACPISSSVENV